MSDERVNLGVIGLGKLGLLHAGLANALPGARLVAVADHQPLVQSALKDHGLDALCFSDHREMLAKASLDALIVATPTHLHVPLALDVIRADKAVFIEKPLAVTAEQSLPLLHELKRHPVVNMVGYMNRFSETFSRARSLIASGMLGRLQMVKASMYISQHLQKGKGWRFSKKEAGGGVLITQNSHLIDFLLWAIGDVKRVNARLGKFYSAEVEDAVFATLEFQGGVLGQITTSWSARHYRILTMTISLQGEGGTLEVNDDEIRFFLDDATAEHRSGWTTLRKTDLFEPVPIDLATPSYTRQALAFLQAVRRKEPASPDVVAAYRTQQVIDAIYRSSERNGSPVELSEMDVL